MYNKIKNQFLLLGYDFNFSRIQSHMFFGHNQKNFVIIRDIDNYNPFSKHVKIFSFRDDLINLSSMNLKNIDFLWDIELSDSIKLDISGNPISNFSCLSKIRLSKLIVYNTELNDISIFCSPAMLDLTHLDLFNCSLSDVSMGCD